MATWWDFPKQYPFEFLKNSLDGRRNGTLTVSRPKHSTPLWAIFIYSYFYESTSDVREKKSRKSRPIVSNITRKWGQHRPLHPHVKVSPHLNLRLFSDPRGLYINEVRLYIFFTVLAKVIYENLNKFFFLIFKNLFL